MVYYHLMSKESKKGQLLTLFLQEVEGWWERKTYILAFNHCRNDAEGIEHYRRMLRVIKKKNRKGTEKGGEALDR